MNAETAEKRVKELSLEKQAHRGIALRAEAAERQAKQAEACCDSYVDENQKLHDRMEAAERKLAEAVWHTFADKPAAGRKFIALHDDGSGAALFFALDGGVIDSDGYEYYDWHPDAHSYDRWTYLPDNIEFWCEIRAEDPVSLRAARAVIEKE